MSKVGWMAALAGLVLAGCPGGEQVRPQPAPDGQTARVAQPDAGVAQDAGRPALEAVEPPVFDPDAPPPCESHTACYLTAKEAHATGERAGYLLALERCAYYRGRYQLEKFYGLCLLILADSYRHLDNFAEARACYRRFLDTGPSDSGLALQARAGIEEIEAGEEHPFLYHDYLQAVSLLTRYNHDPRPALVEEAGGILRRIQQEQSTWSLAGKIEYLLEQIGKLGEAGDGGDAAPPELVPLASPPGPAPTPVDQAGNPAPDGGLPDPGPGTGPTEPAPGS